VGRQQGKKRAIGAFEMSKPAGDPRGCSGVSST
jgi:hypothetical protein